MSIYSLITIVFLWSYANLQPCRPCRPCQFPHISLPQDFPSLRFPKIEDSNATKMCLPWTRNGCAAWRYERLDLKHGLIGLARSRTPIHPFYSPACWPVHLTSPSFAQSIKNFSLSLLIKPALISAFILLLITVILVISKVISRSCCLTFLASHIAPVRPQYET